MKYLLTAVLSVLLISGCSLSPVKQTPVQTSSDEAVFISAVTANGCSLDEIDMTKAMGKMKIKCK